MTGADGALYVSDDNKGFIYRITIQRNLTALTIVQCDLHSAPGCRPAGARFCTSVLPSRHSSK